MNNKQKSILNYFTTYQDKETEDIKVNDNTNIICFTDGACIHNGKKYAKGSWAAVFPFNTQYNTSGKLNDGVVATNNRAEYTALIKAFQQADKIDPQYRKSLTVYSDSELLIKSITNWLKNWKRNNWKKSDGNIVLNKDLLMIIDYHMSKRNLFMSHVRSHTGKQDFKSIWNDKADELAKQAL